MYYSIFPTQDAWISSGSNAATTGISEIDQNYGQDEILELKKNFYNDSFDYQTRVLLNFSGDDFTELSKSIQDGKIKGDYKFFLRLYEADGNKELSTEYSLEAHPLSQSWDEGRGKFGDNPKVVDGVSWDNRKNKPGATEVSWSQQSTGSSTTLLGTPIPGGNYLTGSPEFLDASQSFSYESPDINMDVTEIVKSWLGRVGVDPKPQNHGFILKFSGSQETDSETFGQLKFFSRNTHTIFSPKLEVRWDDHIAASGSNIGSLQQISMSGAQDNYVYPIGLKESYREDEKVKFRFGIRKRYIQKSFSTSVQSITGSYIKEKSGSYSIVDVATGESIVPFKDNIGNVYSYLSADSTSNYFIQWLNTFSPDRLYKILIKVNYEDNQEIIYDNDWLFKVKR